MTTISLDYAGENRIFTALHKEVQDQCKENTISSLQIADQNYQFMLDLQLQTGRISAEGKEGLLKAWKRDYKRLLKTAKSDPDDLLDFVLN